MDQNKRAIAALRHWYQRAFPNHCVLCDAPSTHALCHDCVDDLPVIEHCCARCALPLDSTATVCGECLQHPPSFNAAFSIFKYRGQVPWLINQFKHHRQHAIGTQLTRALLNALPANLDIDYVTPVPLHWRRLLQRGFNQAERIAAPIAAQLNRPLLRVVRKIRHAQHQQDLTRKQRIAAARKNFEVCSQVTGQRILLVDDVMTTGATLESISHLLRQAGAREITVVTLSRTPKQSSYK